MRAARLDYRCGGGLPTPWLLCALRLCFRSQPKFLDRPRHGHVCEAKLHLLIQARGRHQYVAGQHPVEARRELAKWKARDAHVYDRIQTELAAAAAGLLAEALARAGVAVVLVHTRA